MPGAQDRNRLVGWITISILFFAVWWLEEMHDSVSDDSSFPGGFTQTHAVGSLVLTVVGSHVELSLYYPAENGKQVLSGILGVDLPRDLPSPSPCQRGSREDAGGSSCFQWANVASLEAHQEQDGCYALQWSSSLQSLQDCFHLGDAHWFGGGETADQAWPLRNSSFDAPFVTGNYFYGVAERYWVTSLGVVLYVEDDVPLFVAANQKDRPELCLTSTRLHPFREQPGLPLPLRYKLCAGPDIRSAHLSALPRFLGKPSGTADVRTLRYPIWSTWARYKTHINDSIVLHFAGEISDNGFNNSQLEVDDKWESCYGELAFDPKFGDPKQLVDQLHSLDFRVTFWVHPFMNFECPSFASVMEKGFFVPEPNGLTGLTTWWNGKYAGILDATDSTASRWWRNRLQKLQKLYGIDSFKFDAGETNFLPYSAALLGPENLQPNIYSTRYAELASLFGAMTEARVGHRSQHLPILVRMLDRDSNWEASNGLRSLIPTVLVFGLLGYPFVLPDMVGGNSYGAPPSRELYVRWMQVNAFMPSIQFSLVPWDFDQEVVQMALNLTQLRDRHFWRILQAAQEAVQTGAPVNRPLWWLTPNDQEAFAIDSEFLVGDGLLVAPVLYENHTSRDIYLPKGLWRDELNPSSPLIEGPTWLTNYPAELHHLPHFTLQNT